MQVVDHIFSFLRHKRAVYSPKGTWFTPTLRTFQVDINPGKSALWLLRYGKTIVGDC